MSNWKNVEFVLHDGSIQAGKAAYSGDGWCDSITIDDDGLRCRFWTKADGSASPPYNNVRLVKPFAEYPATPS